MIGLIRLKTAVPCAWVVELESLPRPPALKFSAFMMRCDADVRMDEVISWFRHVRLQRPHLPIGAVLAAGEAAAITALREGIQFKPVIEEHELNLGRLPLSLLDTVRDQAVEGRLLNAWSTRWNLKLPEVHALAAGAAAVGVGGGQITTLGRVLRSSPATLYRRFRRAGLPTPGKLLAMARLEAVAIRLELGISSTAACTAAGWSTSAAYRKALHRAEHQR